MAGRFPIFCNKSQIIYNNTAMFLEDLQNKLRNSFIYGYKDHDRARVERDWLSIFGFFLILSIINILCSAYLFLQINKGSILVVAPEENTHATVLNLETLDSVLRSFEEKEDKFSKLKNSTPQTPSVR